MSATPPKKIPSVENPGPFLGIYSGLVHDLTYDVNYGPSVEGPNGEVAPGGIDAQFMYSSLINPFNYSSGQTRDLTKAIDNLSIDSGTLAVQKTYLRCVLLIGMVDNETRPSVYSRNTSFWSY